MKWKNLKPLALLVATLLTLSLLAACGTKTEAPATPAPAGEGETAPAETDKVYNIGIIQSVEHPALDATYEGFVAALADAGYKEGEKITLDLQNAQGDMSNLSTIGDRFVSRNSDLVLAISTDAAQTMVGKTTEIPLLATAVTSYTASGLVDSDEAPGGNLSGTSDMNPVAAQIKLIQELIPEVKTIGLIYNSSEANSTLQIKMAKEEIEKLGLAHTEVTVTNSNEVLQAMEQLMTTGCEAVYIPTDNTLASAMPTVYNVTSKAKIPTFCGADTMVLEGGLATMGINYYDLGYQTGEMAVEVLEGKNPGEMPIQYAKDSDLVTINGQVAEEIGFEIPAEYKDQVVMPESN